MTPEETVELPDDAGEWDDEWGGKVDKTPEEKIAALVEHIKKEFPNGCDTVKCEDCPLLMFTSDYDTIEYNICEMLSRTESGPSL